MQYIISGTIMEKVDIHLKSGESIFPSPAAWPG